MDGGAYLDMPNAARGQRFSRNNHEHLLALHPAYRGTPEPDQEISRFRSLRGLSQAYEEANTAHDHSNHKKLPVTNTSEVVTATSPQNEHFEHEPKKAHSLSNHPPKLWTPIWLRKWTLCLFAILFLSSIAGLLILWHFSTTRNGFDIGTTNSHYAWTYGPTALLVIMVGLWRQVDFHCKSLAPWDELRKGPVVASRSLLVDYISPFQAVAFFRAVRNRNIPVMLTIIGFTLLKIITIFSTSLFVLLPTIISTKNFPAVATSNFTSSTFDPTVSPSSLAFPLQPIYARLGNIAYNIPLPIGVTDSFAYIPVTLGDHDQQSPGNATYDLEADAFVPSLACSAVDVNVTNPTSSWLYNFTAPVSSPDTTIRVSLPSGNGCDFWPNVSISTLDPRFDPIPSTGSQIIGKMQGIGCADDQGLWTGSGQTDKILFTIMELQYQQTNFTNQTIANSSRVVMNISSVLCSASYQLTRAHIWNNTSAANNLDLRVSLITDAANSTFDDFSFINITNLYLGAWGTNYDLFADNNSTLYLNNVQSQNVLFKLMAIDSGTHDMSTLLVDSNLRKSAESTFNGIMSYYASSNLTSSGGTSSVANATYLQDRLHVNSVSLWIMVVAFAIVTLLCLVLILIGPGAVVPRDPFTIAATATTLTRSTDLNNMLQRKSNPSWQELKFILANHRYGTAIATTDQGITSFQIVVSGDRDKRVHFSQSTSKNWLPFAASMPIWVLSVAFLLALIAVLEILQQRSDRHQGLLAASESWKTNIYIHILPALVLLLAATTINNLNFYIALFSPWSKLVKGNGKANQTLLSNLLGQIPPVAIFKRLRLGYWNAALSTIAAIIASVLVIAVSGLYELQDYNSTGPLQDLVRQDSFNIQNYLNALNASGAANIMTIMTQSNLEYPIGTYDELALPTYSLATTADKKFLSNSSVGPSTAQISALRGNLRCHNMPATAINVLEVPLSDSNDSTYREYDIMPTFSLPDECQYQQNNITTSNITLRQRYGFSSTTTEYFLGTIFDFASIDDTETAYTMNTTTSDNPSCPSLGFLFGKLTPGSNSSEALTAFVCYQEVQTVMTNITFYKNTTKLDLTHPPTTEEGSVVALTSPSSANGSTVFNFHFKSALYSSMQQVQNQSDIGKQQNYESGYNFDDFFTWCISGTNNTDPNLFVGASNEVNLVNSINRGYRRYMAQVYNLVLRDPIAKLQPSNNHMLTARQDSGSAPQAQNTISTTRVIQDNTSKIILQVLLGISAILISIAYLSTPMRKVLPINPCSIAGRMSLLAGSRLCSNSENTTCSCCGKLRKSYTNSNRGHPGENSPLIRHGGDHVHQPEEQIIGHGAEFMSEADFVRVFTNGDSYSMGWWRAKGTQGLGRNRYGVDVGSRADGGDDVSGEAEIPTIGQSPLINTGTQVQIPFISHPILAPTDTTIITNTHDERGAYQRAEVISPIHENRHMTYQRSELVSPIQDTDMNTSLEGTISRNTSSQRPHTISSSIYDEDNNDREDEIIDSYRRNNISPSVYDEYDEADIGIAVSDERRQTQHNRF